MYVREEMRAKIINMFFYTKMRPKTILKEVAPDGEITLEDIYRVLNEYKEQNPDVTRIKKQEYFSVEISDKELYELKEDNLSYDEIVRYFADKNIHVTRSFIVRRCKDIYDKKGEKVKVPIKEVLPYDIPKEILSEKIFELREKRYSYVDIIQYFVEHGVEITLYRVKALCREIYKEKGIEVPRYARRNCSKFNDDIDKKILELRKSRNNI